MCRKAKMNYRDVETGKRLQTSTRVNVKIAFLHINAVSYAVYSWKIVKLACDLNFFQFPC